MPILPLVKIGVPALVAVALLVEALVRRRGGRPPALAAAVLGLTAAAWLAIVGALWADHIGFPLHLDLMEGTILQHFQRAAAGLAVYPEPSPAFVPLAYNPLFYYLAVPLVPLFGISLFTLRLVAIAGAALSACLVFLAVRGRGAGTGGGTWWGLIAAGLFAAAYVVMNNYLDTAHADSWLLACALGGTLVLDRWPAAAGRLTGTLILVLGFWFKQHGALFCLGGLAWLLWRDGLWRSLPALALALLLGPVAYLTLGPAWFGPWFETFTWRVPSQWTELTPAAVRRYGLFLLTSYPLLLLATLAALLQAVRHRRRDGTPAGRETPSLWLVQAVVALASGFMGALDPGSANNVFIAAGAFLIIAGTRALRDLAVAAGPGRAGAVLAPLALALSFSPLMFDPQPLLVPARAGAAYADLVGWLSRLPGTVYAPTVAQLPGGYQFWPAAHWVALEDMIRGPHRVTDNDPNTRRLLAPALAPAGPAWILANRPLTDLPAVPFLTGRYVLDQDLGDRFKALRVLPGRWDHGWPRYLYRYDPAAAAAACAEPCRPAWLSGTTAADATPAAPLPEPRISTP